MQDNANPTLILTAMYFAAELTCQVYEAAIKKDPLNEEFLSHLFMGYVRIGDYRKQQQTAMALFKVKPKNPYYFWAVMSILMQVMLVESNVFANLSISLPFRPMPMTMPYALKSRCR